MPIRHLAFDLDETLIDTRDQIVESIMACLAREQRTKNTRSRLHRDAHRSPKAILGEFGIASLKAYWRHHAALVGHALLFFDNTVEVFERLQEAGIPLSLITSLPRRPAKCLLQRYDLERFFVHIDTFASRPYRKPSPKLLSIHLKDLGLSCKDAAYIGDSEGDMRMAKAAGSAAWAVGWGPHL